MGGRWHSRKGDQQTQERLAFSLRLCFSCSWQNCRKDRPQGNDLRRRVTPPTTFQRQGLADRCGFPLLWGARSDKDVPEAARERSRSPGEVTTRWSRGKPDPKMRWHTRDVSAADDQLLHRQGRSGRGGRGVRGGVLKTPKRT